MISQIHKSLPDAEVRLRSIEQTCQILSLSRAKIHKLVADGRLRKIKVGRKALISQNSISGFLRELGV